MQWRLGILGCAGSAMGLVLLAGGLAAARKPRPQPCVGRYLLGSTPLTGGPGAAKGDAVQIAGDAVQISGICTSVRPKTLHALRGGVTTVKVVWPTCNGFRGRVKLQAKVTDGCSRIKGKLTARKFKKAFTAPLSRCGDGTLDPPNGEACEPPGSSTCSATCQPNFTNLSLASTQVQPIAGLTATLDGALSVSSAGRISGQVVATYGAGGSATIVAGTDGTIVVQVGTSSFDVLGDYGESVALDGSPMSVEAALDIFRADATSGLDPSQWSALSQATLALLSLTSAPAFQANAAVAHALGIGTTGQVAASRARGVVFVPMLDDPGELLFNAGIICKTAVYTASAAVMALLGGGCVGLTALCLGASTVTFGAITLSCVALGSLCTFVGTPYLSVEAHFAIAEQWKRAPCGQQDGSGFGTRQYPFCSSRGTCSSGQYCGVAPVGNQAGVVDCACVPAGNCAGTTPACGGKCPAGQQCQHRDFPEGSGLERQPRNGFCECIGTPGAPSVTISAPGTNLPVTGDSVPVLGNVAPPIAGGTAQISVDGIAAGSVAIDAAGNFSGNAPLDKRLTVSDLTLTNPDLPVNGCGPRATNVVLGAGKTATDVTNVIDVNVFAPGDSAPAAGASATVIHTVRVDRFRVTWNDCPPFNKNEFRADSLAGGQSGVEVGTVECGITDPNGFSAPCSVTAAVDTTAGTVSSDATWTFTVPSCP